MSLAKNPLFHPIGAASKSSGFQVTDEFMEQLPQQLIVPSSHLQLFETVGQGAETTCSSGCTCRIECNISKQYPYTTVYVYLHNMYSLNSPSNMIIGEFGVVYRGKLLRKQGRNRPGFVAVKTMRGR